MKSIKTRLVVNFMLIIVFTVIILEFLLIYAVEKNYYKNLEESITNQIKISTDLYNRYFSEESLEENVLNNVDTFWRQSSCQVQIINKSGEIIMDSIGIIPSNNVPSSDIREALNDKKGVWVGKVSYDKGGVMSVSYPLRSGDKIVGVLRFISSLREVNGDVREIAYIFLGIGLIVMLISGVLSIFFASSIIVPLNEVTRAAEKMAGGDFRAVSRKLKDDEIGKLSDTLNYMAEEILKKDELKNNFISSVSHELRTPLTSIKGWAFTLQKEQFQTKETLNDGLKIIEKESDRLTSMVEELLDFSKFVAGKITIKKEKVNIIELMDHIGKQLRPRALRDNINFEVDCSLDRDLIISDENRLKQLFINLIDNAFNFTPSGGKVIFKAHEEDNRLFFKVEDNGCGISEEELPRIKEKFYKGKTSKSRNGIGLSICDEIVRLLGGNLEIESRLNEGTKVSVTLPIINRMDNKQEG